MKLDMQQSAGIGYKSGCQITRRISEQWAADNLFCVACNRDSVVRVSANTKAIDFSCPSCDSAYQLKAGRNWNEHRIPDAGYTAMIAAIRSDRVPNLLIMQYSDQWCVQNLMLVPSFLFNESAIQRRNPLGPNARRAGWIGCNILLSAMPKYGKIRIVEAGMITRRKKVRTEYERLKPLATIVPTVRGWTLDVLKVVQSIGKKGVRPFRGIRA